MKPHSSNCFIPFKENIQEIPLPEKFTFPFYYEPHPLSVLAAKDLQRHLQEQTEWVHNFGIDPTKEGLVIGKMFGVLVVQNEVGVIGYLAAFSGKLADQNHHKKFVPPVFDMLGEDSFFNIGVRGLNQLNQKVDDLEKEEAYLTCKALFAAEQKLVKAKIAEEKAKMKAAKKNRKERRKAGEKNLMPTQLVELKKQLARESLQTQRYFQEAVRYWEGRLSKQQEQLDQYLQPIKALKEQRKNTSNALQQRLFESYNFLNQSGETKNLLEIFAHTTLKKPPAGSGECAAPKLLHYAFQHQLKPLAMAEFWWGASMSEIRRHGNYYPACRGKCEPILAHMLEGMDMEVNPMLTNPAIGKVLTTVYEDESLLVINKPTEFLSVPGKNIQDSVWLRMKQRFPKATGPLIVHRLDMSTSGLMVIAKTKEVHKILQQQFIKRTVKKRYIALLDGVVEEDTGYINLPLRVDLDNRPHQLVCYEYGKSAQTRWEVINRTAQQTRIHFFPLTGRTHQLRVHAAHPKGLNAPIVGDDLYGIRLDRLHLHAEWISFEHPVTEEFVEFEVEANF